MKRLNNKFKSIYSEKQLRTKAYESGFCKRQSKFSPSMFFDSLLYEASNETTKSYNQLAIEVKNEYDVDMSKQGIGKRFNESALHYIQLLVGEQLSQQITKAFDVGWLTWFNRVIIKDGTRFDLPKTLKEELPGYGGGASDAGACIQYEFDIKSGFVNDMDITPARRPDSKDALKGIDRVEKGDLYIRDLGYFSINYFKAIEAKGAFYISRLCTSICVYQEKGQNIEKLDFEKLYKEMEKNGISRVEKKVLIGSEDHYPVRLVIELMPDEIYNVRMNKLNKHNKKKGHQTSQEYTNRARFNLFITNITLEVMDSEPISRLYKLRWQIELVFKIWKSTFGLDNVRMMRYYRLMCILNARLLLILINWETITGLRGIIYEKTGKILSLDKCFKTLKDNMWKLRQILRNDCSGLNKWYKWLEEILSSRHWLEERKRRKGLREILQLNYCISN